MKTAVSYSAFDGIELLEYSIKQIRDSVDYVNVIYQEKSFFGTKAKKEDLNTIKRLNSVGLIDDIQIFKPSKYSKDYSNKEINNAKRLEREKRQMGLNMALSKGVDYWMSMDVDEFYITEEFDEVKREIIQNGYKRTACKIVDYHNKPIFRLKELEENGKFYVPFLTKVNASTEVGDNFDMCNVDPTRGVKTKAIGGLEKIFDENELKMHHMKTVRKNLYSKFENTSRRFLDRSKLRARVNKIRNYHPETHEEPKGEVVENIFNIPLDLFK